MEPAHIVLLHALIRRESRSLLQYAREAYPWSKANAPAAGAAVQAMGAAEAEMVGRLSQWMAKQKAPISSLGAYPMQFTTMNYTSVHSLLPRLIADAQVRIAEIERSCLVLPAGEGRALVQSLVDLKKAHLERLRELQATTTPPALAS